jgi:hypothetical protein
MESGERSAATDAESARIIATYELEKHRRTLSLAEKKMFDGGDLEGAAVSLRERMRWQLIVSIVIVALLAWAVVASALQGPRDDDPADTGAIVFTAVVPALMILVLVFGVHSMLRTLLSARAALGLLQGSRTEPPPTPMEFVRQELAEHRVMLLYAQRMALDRGEYAAVARLLQRRAKRSIVVAYLGGPMLLYFGLGMPGIILADGSTVGFHPLELILGVYVLDQCLRRAMHTVKKMRAILRIVEETAEPEYGAAAKRTVVA